MRLGAYDAGAPMTILLWCSCAVFFLAFLSVDYAMENPLKRVDLTAFGFCLFVAAQAVGRL